MKRILFFLLGAIITLTGHAQNKSNTTEDDLQYFYTTLQGNYSGDLNDSTKLDLHLTPIWEQQSGRWLYLEATTQEGQTIVEQKILEIVPVSDIVFNVIVHGIRHPEALVGKWSNPNFFDGYNTHLLKGKKTFMFLKTKDHEYQTDWNRRKLLKCFPSGDRIHFKFVREDERLYIKRLPTKSTRIIGYTLFKTE